MSTMVVVSMASRFGLYNQGLSNILLSTLNTCKLQHEGFSSFCRFGQCCFNSGIGCYLFVAINSWISFYTLLFTSYSRDLKKTTQKENSFPTWIQWPSRRVIVSIFSSWKLAKKVINRVLTVLWVTQTLAWPYQIVIAVIQRTTISTMKEGFKNKSGFVISKHDRVNLPIFFKP